MADRSKWFEVFVAALGVTVTGVLGYGQWQLGEQQNLILANQTTTAERRSVDTIEVQVMTLVSPHLSVLGSKTPEGKRSERVVLAAAEYLSDQFGRASLAKMAAKISEGNKDISEPVRTRLEEASQAAPKSRTYFTVLASLPGNNLAAARITAKEKLKKAKVAGLDQAISIYKTKLSNNYAVVIGGELSEADARSLAAAARSAGLADDSFHQIDKEWAFIESVLPE